MNPSMCMFTLYDRGVQSSSLYELYIDIMKVVGDCLMTADLGEEIVSKDQSTMPGEKSWEKGNKVYTSWPHSVVYVCASSQLYNSRKKYLKTEKKERRWGDLDWRFMTDESSGSEGSLYQHPLPWRRSKGECYLLFANMQIAPNLVRCFWQPQQLYYVFTNN